MSDHPPELSRTGRGLGVELRGYGYSVQLTSRTCALAWLGSFHCWFEREIEDFPGLLRRPLWRARVYGEPDDPVVDCYLRSPQCLHILTLRVTELRERKGA